MAESPSRTRRSIAPILLLLVVTAAAFSEARSFDFVAWDDDVNLYQNERFIRGTPDIAYFWRTPFFGMYIPVTYTVWGLLAAVAKQAPAAPGMPALNPSIFHLANLGLHLLNVLLVFAILRRLLDKEWAAAAGALLFGVHPIQVEAVAWSTGMKDVLGGFFSLLALWGYLSYAAEKRARPRGWKYAAATLAYALALLSKPSSAAMPVVAWVLDCFLLRRSWRQATGALAPWAILAVPAAIATKLAQDPDASVGFITPLWARPLVAGDALAFYLGKLALPVGLIPDYSRSPASILKSGQVYYTWLVPAALAGIAWTCRRRWPWLPVSLAVFVAGLLPVLGFTRFVFQELSTVADRYVYLSMLGPALALASLAVTCDLRWVRAGIGGILAVLAGLTLFQSLHWYGTQPLFEHTLTVNPRSTIAHNNLGALHYMRGDYARAATHYQASLEVLPNDAPVHDNLAMALLLQGKQEEAVRHWEEALRIDPGWARAHFNYGAYLASTGRMDEAREHWREAVRCDPEFVPARRALEQAGDVP